MSVNHIASGFYNNLTNKESELHDKRMNVCKSCKLYKIDRLLGKVCNSKLFLNPDTDETSKEYISGYKRGCGCILNAKTRVKDAECPLKKW